MQTPTLHNFISTVDSDLFLNIFTEETPYYFLLLGNYNPKEAYNTPCTFEELYQYIQEEDNHDYIIPTSATTPEEARLLHPELFI